MTTGDIKSVTLITIVGGNVNPATFYHQHGTNGLELISNVQSCWTTADNDVIPKPVGNIANSTNIVFTGASV